MKTTYIYSVIIATFLSLSLPFYTSASSLAKIKADGDARTGNSTGKSKESAGLETREVIASDEKDFSYLRFDVNKYANPERDLSIDANATFNSPDNGFNYLKFDASRYVNSGDLNSEDGSGEVDEAVTDFSYLKFDVTKYSSNDQEILDEPVNP
jgi:hypothetical protein